MNLHDVLLVVVLSIAVFFDYNERRIPNILLASGLILALLLHAWTGGSADVLSALKGLGTGLALLIIPFVLGGMGAGDVKLLGFIGACQGSIFALNTFLWMAIWGGIIAVIILAMQRQFGAAFKRLRRGVFLAGIGMANLTDMVHKDEFSMYYPYAIPIALGVLSSFIRGWC